MSRILAACLWLIGSLASAQDISQVKESGPVKVTTSLSPAEPTIGDEIVLQVSVEAERDVEVLMPEFGEALNRYTIVDFVPRERIDGDGRRIFKQRYTIQPYASGSHSIPPILIEFVDRRPGRQPAPDDFDAYEVLTDRIDFTIKSVLPSSASAELRPPLGELELPSERRGSGWPWVAAVALLIAIGISGAVIFWSRWRRRAVRRDAYEIARGQLDQLLSRPAPQTASEVQAFFVTISSIVRLYLENRFELRAPELTTEEFLDLASRGVGLSDEHQRLLRDFLRQADLVKFAGTQASTDEIERSAQSAQVFLEETRENAPLVEEPVGPPGEFGLRKAKEVTHA